MSVTLRFFLGGLELACTQPDSTWSPSNAKSSTHIFHALQILDNDLTPKPTKTSLPPIPIKAAIMPAFDYCPDRPENIDSILNGLDRYNPETTQVFQEYVAQQCENQTYDCYANLALLKL